jgi:hypothetical protein
MKDKLISPQTVAQMAGTTYSAFVKTYVHRLGLLAPIQLPIKSSGRVGRKGSYFYRLSDVKRALGKN